MVRALALLFPGRTVAAPRSSRVAEDGVLAHPTAQKTDGMDLAAVNSRVLTKPAATQVATVRHTSAVIVSIPCRSPVWRPLHLPSCCSNEGRGLVDGVGGT